MGQCFTECHKMVPVCDDHKVSCDNILPIINGPDRYMDKSYPLIKNSNNYLIHENPYPI